MNDIDVRRWPVLRDATGAVRGYVPYMSFDLPLFFRLLTAKRPDAVVNEPPPTTGLVTAMACGIRRIPHIYFAADIVSDAARAQGTTGRVVDAVTWMERTAMKRATAVIAVSQGVADRVQAISGREAVVVPNGIDTTRDETSDGELSEDRGLVPEGFPQTSGPVFLYAGTVAQWLAPEIFIDAFEKVKEKLPEARLVYLGQGSAWAKLRDRARGIAGIEFHPTVSAEEAQRWYALATASLASMKPGAYDYAYPTKILSSLSAGTPVIFAGPGQAALDVAEANLGCAVDVDVDAVCDAMVELATLDDSDPRCDRARLHRWVVEHRSVALSSARAAAIVLEVAQSSC